MRRKLGEWRWFMGVDETDDEMMDCGTREQAIKDGQRQYEVGETFYIVEARFLQSNEQAMDDGAIDTAPFAETRNGEFIVNGPTT